MLDFDMLFTAQGRWQAPNSHAQPKGQKMDHLEIHTLVLTVGPLHSTRMSITPAASVPTSNHLGYQTCWSTAALMYNFSDTLEHKRSHAKSCVISHNCHC